MTARTRVMVVASTPMAQAGLRSMLAESEDASVHVVGGSAGHVPDLSEAEVVVVVGEDLLKSVAAGVSGDGIQGLVLVSDEERAASRLRDLPLRGWGIVEPEAPPEELGAAVAAVARGLVVLPRSLAGRLAGESAVAAERLAEPLTEREHQVLGLIGRGLSNKQIAGKLFISEHTVKFHISSLYEKLDVNNRAEAVRQGARHGLISL